MMELLWSPRSPFVRKVMISLHELGLQNQVTLTPHDVALTKPPSLDVLSVNPLGKIPALILEDKTVLFDSRVICEYLNHLGKGSLFPEKLEDRAQHLVWQALGDGLTDILLLWRTEIGRAEKASDDISAGFQSKVCASMKRLESFVPTLREQAFGIGHIAIICALGQMDFRWEQSRWRDFFPQLADWCGEMAKRPSVEENLAPRDETPIASQLEVPTINFEKE